MASGCPGTASSETFQRMQSRASRFLGMSLLDGHDLSITVRNGGRVFVQAFDIAESGPPCRAVASADERCEGLSPATSSFGKTARAGTDRRDERGGTSTPVAWRRTVGESPCPRSRRPRADLIRSAGVEPRSLGMNVAVIILDMAKGYGWAPGSYGYDMVARVRRLKDAAHAVGAPVIHVNSMRSGERPGRRLGARGDEGGHRRARRDPRAASGGPGHPRLQALPQRLLPQRPRLRAADDAARDGRHRRRLDRQHGPLDRGGCLSTALQGRGGRGLHDGSIGRASRPRSRSTHSASSATCCTARCSRWSRWSAGTSASRLSSAAGRFRRRRRPG